MVIVCGLFLSCRRCNIVNILNHLGFEITIKINQVQDMLFSMLNRKLINPCHMHNGYSILHTQYVSRCLTIGAFNCAMLFKRTLKSEITEIKRNNTMPDVILLESISLSPLVSSSANLLFTFDDLLPLWFLYSTHFELLNCHFSVCLLPL